MMYPNKIIDEDLQSIISSDINWTEFEDKTILFTGCQWFSSSIHG
jgi:hypothetical protein